MVPLLGRAKSEVEVLSMKTITRGNYSKDQHKNNTMDHIHHTKGESNVSNVE